MQETAKTFFASDLPTEIGDEKTLTLEEMIYLNLSDKLTYGKTVCDINDSYISITKLTTNEYQVKSNLVCGDKQEITSKSCQSLPEDFLIRYNHDMQGWIPSEVK